MDKQNKNTLIAKTLANVAESALSSAANSRCVFVYHQPKQPKELKQFRKF